MKDSTTNLNGSAGQWRFTHPTAFASHLVLVRWTSLLVLLLLGWLDFITGYEFGFFIFYFVPVAIAAWYCGPREGYVIAVASAVCWYLSDQLSHHVYSRAFFVYWETFMRLLSFLTTATTLSKIRSMVLNEERLIDELLTARRQLEKFSSDPR